MNTKRYRAVTFAVCLVSLLLAGCTKWLEVDPYDKKLESKVFGSEKEVNKALNGLYLQMSHVDLYGSRMTSGTMELLAQRYAVAIEDNLISNPAKYYTSRYEYGETSARGVFDAIWTKAYEVIMNTNFFIAKLEATEGVVPADYKNMMLGEAYAIKAFLHFDMLRLFGPVYAASPDALSIPYYDKAEAVAQPLLAASAVAGKIQNDLDRALVLLEKDPVKTSGPWLSTTGVDVNDVFYHSFRNRRMNYFAVKALKARVHMYAGEKREAAAIADEILSTVDVFFRWTTSGEFTDSKMPDRIFSREVLFGINVSDMYLRYEARFSSNITDMSAFYGSLYDNLAYAFNSTVDFNKESDLRAKNWAMYGYTQDGDYYYTLKFSRLSDSKASFYGFQPLIRKSELYYMKAEYENCMAPISAVRAARKSSPYSGEGYDDVQLQIEKEYMREFYGEGQLFFFFKRLNYRVLRSGTKAGEKISMSEESYIPYLPIKETEN
ncbi:RagB/SusD family nutrient uptake outer membrane protein [Alistipes sp. OttesenSCG-928-B03]|nr:RagB/SusD family nutrient uptake outer membrane protein [Alistipes sp. OttesenSCG-928-B03]